MTTLRLEGPVYILAINFLHAEHVARSLGLPRSDWRPITNTDRLNGVEGGTLIADYSARERFDWDGICCLAIARGMQVLHTE